MSTEKLRNNRSKATIRDFTKLKNEIKEGKLDDKFKDSRDKKFLFKSLSKMIREEQEKVEDFEKKGVGPAGMRIKETKEEKMPGIRRDTKDFFFKKGGEVKGYKKGGSVRKKKNKMATTKGWGASRKT